MSIAINEFPIVPVKTYEVLRDELRSGDMLLCSGTAFFASLIKKATKSVWSHVAFILRLDIVDRIMVLESVESIGVRTIPLSAYAHNYNGTHHGYPGRVLIARCAQFEPEHISTLSKLAIDFLGHPYDSKEILRIATRIMVRATGISLPQEVLKQGDAYTCSEYAYMCYESVGVHIDHEPDGFVMPADFAKTSIVTPVSFIQT